MTIAILTAAFIFWFSSNYFFSFEFFNNAKNKVAKKNCKVA